MTLNDIARIAYETDRCFREHLFDEGVLTKGGDNWCILSRKQKKRYRNDVLTLIYGQNRNIKNSAVFKTTVLQLAPFLDDQESKI